MTKKEFISKYSGHRFVRKYTMYQTYEEQLAWFTEYCNNNGYTNIHVDEGCLEASRVNDEFGHRIDTQPKEVSGIVHFKSASYQFKYDTNSSYGDIKDIKVNENGFNIGNYEYVLEVI